MENSTTTEITPRTITELKQIGPEEISLIAEQVVDMNSKMTRCNEELENLSACINDLAYTKAAYDKTASTVKKQMREIIPVL